MTRPLTASETLSLAARLRAEAGEPEPPAVPAAVRVEFEAAERHIAAAAQICRDAGCGEAADWIARTTLAGLRTWTGPDGALDHLGVQRGGRD